MFKFTNKPSFLIIGAQKAGTSSLFHYLAQHPDIHLPSEKELHFFDLHYDKGIAWYERRFPGKKLFKRQITGEASPYYLFHPLVPGRIRNHYPDIKLIVLLRNPIDRAYSHFQMERNRNAEPELFFMRAVELENERITDEEQQITSGRIQSGDKFRNWSYLRRGLYGQQIARWLHYFPAEQFLFIKSEDFFSDTLIHLEHIHTFLRIPSTVPVDISPVNSNRYPDLDTSDRKKLENYFREDGQLLRRLVGNDFYWF
jgi:Sulfotransferase domain